MFFSIAGLMEAISPHILALNIAHYIIDYRIFGHPVYSVEWQDDSDLQKM
jgi:hypothetical protein